MELGIVFLRPGRAGIPHRGSSHCLDGRVEQMWGSGNRTMVRRVEVGTAASSFQVRVHLRCSHNVLMVVILFGRGSVLSTMWCEMLILLGVEWCGTSGVLGYTRCSLVSTVYRGRRLCWTCDEHDGDIGALLDCLWRCHLFCQCRVKPGRERDRG